MTEARDERLPVIVGVGQLRSNRERTIAGVRPPIDLVLEAVGLAAADSHSPSLLSDVDSIDVVKVASWAYDDMPDLIASHIAASPARCRTTPLGGHWPAQLLDEAAARIATGESRICLLAGGEAQASVSLLRKAGIDPRAHLDWLSEPGGPPSFDLDELGSDAMQAAGLLSPTRVYPLFENRFRHDQGLSTDSGNDRSAQLYAAFTEVAARNPAAWNPTPRSATDIGTVSAENRLVCEPYPLSMNAMPHVDMAAAVIVTSRAEARRQLIPDSQLVYVWGGAGARDDVDILRRPSYSSSAALVSATTRALSTAGVRVDDLDVVDVYSCFPIVPELMMSVLGCEDAVVPSVTGGHSAFGGPLNSYTLHAIAAVTQAVRRGSRLAMVHGNGGYLTYQHAVLLSSEAHTDGYVGNPNPVDTAGDAPDFRAPVDGQYVVETATVEHDRSRSPTQAFVVLRDSDGRRSAGSTALGDIASAQRMSQLGPNRDAIIGAPIEVNCRGGHVVLMG